MTAQRQGFLKQREAGLRIELAAAERRLSEQVMRYEMIESYLSALYDMKIDEMTRDDLKKYRALMMREEVRTRQNKRIPPTIPGQDAVLSYAKRIMGLYKKKAMRTQGLIKGGPYDQAAQSYAQISCLYLATKLQAHLPREVRDLIYAYVWDDEYLDLATGYMVPDAEKSYFIWTKPHLTWRRDKPPHVINPAYVDPATAVEALAAYYPASAYRKNAFVIRCTESLQLDALDALLNDDVFKLGLRPADHLRALDLHLTQEQRIRYKPATINPDGLSKQFTHIFNAISRKKDFKLRITFMQFEIRLKQWEQLFPVLVPIYHAFRAEGADVSISFSLTTHYYQAPVRCDYDLEEIVKVWTPELEWKGKMLEFFEGATYHVFPAFARQYRYEDGEEEEDEWTSDDSDEDELDEDAFYSDELVEDEFSFGI